MADKSSELILDALSRAVLDPEGVPLHGSKSTQGLFPSTSTAKQAAKRCKEAGFVRVVGTEQKGKSTLEKCAITEKGLAYLFEEANPKDVLEDFVRALEARESQFRDMVDSVRETQRSMEALRCAAAVVIQKLIPRQVPGVNGTYQAESTSDERPWQSTAMDLLRQWRASGSSEDCPLPVLIRELRANGHLLSIGEFHDGVRKLYDAEQIYLHPWTGPLYDMPEPSYALLIGHEILYYASPR